MPDFITFLLRLRYMMTKEMLATLKDPASRILLVAPPLLQGLLFGYAASFNLINVPYVLVDQSRSATPIEYLARLDGTDLFQRIATLVNADEISPYIDSGKALLAIQIGREFENLLAMGQNAPIQVIADGRNSMTASVALGYLGDVTSTFNAEHTGNIPPISLSIRTWYNPNQITRWNFMPGIIATFGMIQVLLLAGLSVAREREQGTFDQLLVTPLTPFEILVGKALPPVFIGLVQSSIVLLICLFWFKIPFSGSFPVLYLTLFIFTLSYVGIGLSISAVAKSMQQVMVYAFCLIMPSVLLSGLAAPVRNMPDILQTATYANPLRFGVECMRRVYLEGSGLPEIAYNYIPMLAVTAITMPLAAWLFRNRLM